jgi:hypothetical protein
MTDTTTQIKAKGCQATGLTDDLASKLYNNLGQRIMAIVELEAHDRASDADGNQKVGLRITMLEPAVDEHGIGDAHLRELTRAMFMNRKLNSPDEQLTIDSSEDLSPKVADVIAASPGIVHHDFVRGGRLDDDTVICEVCGESGDYYLHKPPVAANPFEITDQPDGPEPADPDPADDAEDPDQPEGD